jgi:hypothetical protein
MKRYALIPLKLALALTLGALAATTAFGQGAKIHMDQLDKLGAKAAESVEVTLDEKLLGIAGGFLAKIDSDTGNGEDLREVREIVAKLKGIYVRSYEFDKDGDYSPADVEGIRSQLVGTGWSKIVNVRSRIGGDNAEVYLLTETNRVAGAVILVASPRELTVVNIVGEVDVDKISKLEGRFGIHRRNRTPQPAEAPETPQN